MPELEWDEIKNQVNFEKHGLDFKDAQEVFLGDCRTVEDNRFDYGETRYATFGSLKGRVVVIVHTERDGKTRIISMRKANNREQRFFLQRLG